MKIVLAIVIALDILSATSSAAEYDSPYTQLVLENFPEGTCLKSSVLGLYTTKALGERQYETVSYTGGQVVSRGLLITVKSAFASPGMTNIVVKYKGVKELPLENGFMAKFGVWEECK